MSRSRRKTPITGVTTAVTEKENKRDANRKLRRLNKIKIHKKDYDLFRLREISNVWAFDKDGKHYVKEPSKRSLRK